jgi:hypothetical protein
LSNRSFGTSASFTLANLTPVREAIEEVLLLQTDYSSKNSDAMQRRGVIVRDELKAELDELLLSAMVAASGIEDLRVRGNDGVGLKTEIPWTRIYSASRSPRPTSGWYVVFLFSAAGDKVYISLNQGTTRWDGADFKPQPADALNARTTWARNILTQDAPFPGGWTTAIELDNRISDLGTGYALGNVIAKEYLLNEIPSDEQIEEDLLKITGWLGQVYRAGDEGLYVPGDAPDVADIEEALEEITHPQRKKKGPRLTGPERRAIELRAVEVTMEHFESGEMGYQVKDVGDRESYDVHATKAGETLKIEVKGTTSNGSEVILTRNEVDLHRKEHPANALAIVRDIKLNRIKDQPPTASGGELILRFPWPVEDDKLAPIAYRYTTGL